MGWFIVLMMFIIPIIAAAIIGYKTGRDYCIELLEEEDKYRNIDNKHHDKSIFLLKRDRGDFGEIP